MSEQVECPVDSTLGKGITPAMHDIEQFQTRRFHARRVSLEDFESLSAMLRDPRVAETLGGVRTLEEVRQGIRHQSSHWDKYGFGVWVFHDQEGQFVGRAGLEETDVGGAGNVELLYTVPAALWGRGIATEMAARCIDIAFDSLGLEQLVAFTLPSNIASRRVMEKLGFTYDRELMHANLQHVFYRLARWYGRQALELPEHGTR
jgi:RimJ/RimL family protein N-acetyltransferase